MNKTDKIFIAGHKGMVGSAIHRKLLSEGCTNILVRDFRELDLMDQHAVSGFFSDEKPDYVFLAAARVGGIYANSKQPAQFIYENMMIQNNVIHHAYLHGVKKLLFLGSSCIYPRMAPQPIREEHLLTGPLEETNKAYALAKISGIIMCQSYRKQYGCNFIAAMPTNLYGYGDNYDPDHSHVIPGLIRRIHFAKTNGDASVEIWGTGEPLREFLFVDDLADACYFLMQHYNEAEIINVGSGEEVTIKDLAMMICKIVGYGGKLIFDPGKPDGTPRKLLDLLAIHKLGWSHSTSIEDGLSLTYADFLKKHNHV
jgi:GDP-L-fucose synthase